MKSRPKDLGTTWETQIVNSAQDLGLVAERIAEGGQYDRGDIRIYTDHEWIGECKNRGALNIHKTLEDATIKSGTSNTFVAWKRLIRVDGRTNRVSAGPPVVVLSVPTFLELLKQDTKGETL
jgi:hypothetical protein